MTSRKNILIILAVIGTLIAILLFVICGKKNVATENNTAISKQSADMPTTLSSVPTESTSPAQPSDTTPATDYKTVSASSSVANISFEVPRDWTTETRHSDDKNTPVAQMREFLATNAYTDFTANQLQAITDAEITKMYFTYIDGYGPAFPNVSVIPAGAISYGDWNKMQIDVFFEKGAVTERVTAQKNFIARACAGAHKQPFCNTVWENTTVQSLPVTIETPEFSPTKNIDKENSGGQRYYIAVPDKNATLIIRKQSRGDQAFEQHFARLLSTLRFE